MGLQGLTPNVEYRTPEYLYQFFDTWFDLRKIVSISECRVRPEFGNAGYFWNLAFGCEVVYFNHSFTKKEEYFYDALEIWGHPEDSHESNKIQEQYSCWAINFDSNKEVLETLKRYNLEPFRIVKNAVDEFIAAWKLVASLQNGNEVEP